MHADHEATTIEAEGADGEELTATVNGRQVTLRAGEKVEVPAGA